MPETLRVVADGWRDFLGFSGFDFLCEIDREGRYLEVSPNYSELLGVDPGHLIGKTPFDLELFHPDDREALMPKLLPLFERNELVRFEYRFKGADDSWRWMETTGNAFLTPSGEWRALLISRDISSRKAAEASQMASEERYRLIIDHAPLGILHFDNKGILQFCNDTYLAQMGVTSRDVLIGLDMVKTLTNEAVRNAVIEALEGRRGFFEGDYVSVTGKREAVLRLHTYGIQAGDGHPLGGIGIVEDITERHRMEEAFLQESSMLRDIIEFNPLSIQLLDQAGYTLKVNAAHTRLFQAVPPPDYSLFLDPLLQEQGLEELLHRMREGQVVQFPEFYHNPHEIYPEFPDRPVWIRMVAFPILGKNGAPERFVLMHEDITERRLAEQAMRNSEARFREFVEGTDDLVTQIDGQGRFLYVNRAASKIFGIPAEDLIGRRAFEFVHPEDQARTENAFKGWIQERVPSTTFENRNVSLNGEVHDLLWTINLHFDNDGLTQLNSIARDMTQWNQTEDILRQSQKLESLGVLAGGIAHDFNNLLTAIMGNLNLAQLKLSPEAPAQPHLEAVERTVLKASDLTRQMLAYSGKGRFVIRNHDLNAVVQEMAHLLHVSISKKVTLRLKLEPDLPAIYADVAQIQQVIMNLVTNASDAIGDREGIIGIATHLQELDEPYIAQTFSTQDLAPGQYVTLEVSDTGCGINSEILEKIFDPFFTTKTSGRGLGLSAMLGILRGHGGGVKIYSELERGTTFKVFLPAGTSKASIAELPPEEDSNNLTGTVLVVDDEPTIRESLENAFESFGMRVITAADGQEGLERFQAEANIDLVLMDLTMPRMDGREAFLAMRKIRPDVRVIISSGYNEQDSVQEFLGKGLAGFIQKPYRLRELRKIVGAALAKH
ncbi:MAG: PAS domain S-box protein [Holophaga sp.]|nr:PAS domain S-box protein [Holophaga sp.]